MRFFFFNPEMLRDNFEKVEDSLELDTVMYFIYNLFTIPHTKIDIVGSKCLVIAIHGGRDYIRTREIG